MTGRGPDMILDKRLLRCIAKEMARIEVIAQVDFATKLQVLMDSRNIKGLHRLASEAQAAGMLFCAEQATATANRMAEKKVKA